MKKSRCMSLAGSVSCLSWFLSIVCAALLSACGVTAVQAQDVAQDESKSGPTASDYAAVDDARLVYRHAKPANTAAGVMLKQKQLAEHDAKVEIHTIRGVGYLIAEDR